MKTNLRFALALFLPLAVSGTVRAQDAPPPDREAAASPAAPTTTTPPKRAADTPRFSSFENASPAVVTAVTQAQAVAESIRDGVSIATATPVLARAVAQAGAAIVQEGRVARTDVLAERQAALTRLRLAQTEQERRRLIDELRARSGQRMEEQREVARLVRDRLRELRDTTALTKPDGN